MYFIITKENSTLDEKTGHWYCDLPDDFVNSNRPKKINVINKLVIKLVELILVRIAWGI